MRRFSHLLLFALLPLFAMGTPTEGTFPLQLKLSTDAVLLTWNGSPAANMHVVEVATETDATGELVFEEIGRLPVASNTACKFEDRSEKSAGLHYYRIVQIDHTGERTYSEVMTANFLFKDNFACHVNADEELSLIDLTLVSNSDGEAQVTLTNLASNEIINRTYFVNAGENQITIPVDPTLPIGKFIFSINLLDATQIVLLEKDSHQDVVVSEE